MKSSSLRRVANASTLNELAAACDNAAATLPSELNELTQHVAAALIFKLIYITPVDTSEALSNWQVGVLFPEFDSLPPYFYGDHGSTAGMSQSSAYIAAQAIIFTKRPNSPIYVSNNAKHINLLNQGKSSQASAGFVDRAILEVNNEAQQIVSDYFGY